MMKNKLRKRYCFAIVLVLIPMHGSTQNNVQGQQNLVDQWNQRMATEGISGEQFQVKQGAILFNGGSPPAWAINATLDLLGIETGYGTGGIHPFKLYTHQEYKQSSLANYYVLRGFIKDAWMQRDGGQGHRLGLGLLQEARDKLGATVFKDLHAYQLRVAERNEYWDNFTARIIPALLATFQQPKVLGLSILAVLLCLGLPIAIWHFTRSLAGWVFVRRPTILGKEDSDIYGNVFQRLFFRFPDLPTIIANKSLQEELDELVRQNQCITKKNKRNPSHHKTPYSHVLAFGEPGVGKTLFGKSLAKQSGMHFMYCTISDISQLPEEEALQTLKDLFAYARKHGPCTFIVDEVDRLFAGEDVKSKKLAVLFQREFSKGIDQDIQLFLITNYPWKLPKPILKRLPKRIYFDNPTFATQCKLFELYLKSAFKLQRLKVENFTPYIDVLDKELLGDLVGRDIESIAINLSLAKDTSPQQLIKEIQAYHLAETRMENFAKAQQPVVEHAHDAKAPPKKFWHR